MKKKLILNTEQFNKLQEATYNIAGDNTGEVEQQMNSLPAGSTFNVEFQGDNINTGDPKQMTQQVVKDANDINGAGNYQITNESIALTKKDIKILSSLNEGDKVFSKSSFKNTLLNEYSDFCKSLNKKRNK